MQYIVVHSNDPYLLARLATDLQMSGVKDKDNDNDPIEEDDNYIAYYSKSVYTGKPAFHFHTDPLRKEELSIELTYSNYLSVLTKILS